MATGSLAGCSSIVDFVGGLVLEDVNVFNTTEEQIAGAIEVTDPDGETVLDETFDLDPGSGGDDGTDSGGSDGENSSDVSDDVESGAAFGDVLDATGEYTVAVDLDDSSIDGESAAEESVEVTDPEEEHVVVALGAEDRAPIAVEVIEALSDLETDATS